METERLYGMAEAERLIALAMRLYEATQSDVPWDKLGPGQRRPFIDQACQTEN